MIYKNDIGAIPPINCLTQWWWVGPTKLLQNKKYIFYLSLAEIIMNIICTCV